MLRMYDVIAKKRDGGSLSEEEIRAVIRGYTDGSIPDYQMSPLLMAISLRGMDAEETASLTDAMMRSGDIADLSAFAQLSADKHSTGGVGDKTTFITAPAAAVLGCKVAKMSGRGLGHTGGTIDKLESIPGYRIALSPAEFERQVSDIGVSVIGATGTIAPADKRIYALRDVTATVESIPLIASSIMSKKLAAGTSSIVLDVTVGSGAFMKDEAQAEALAQAMVDIGTRCGKTVTAVLTDMDQPLGRTIGNQLELEEAVSFLQGNGEGLEDLCSVSLTLAAHMAANVHGIDPAQAYDMAYRAWRSGEIYERFLAWISAQGGDAEWIAHPERHARAPYTRAMRAERGGYLAKTDAEKIGIAAMVLGAGRRTKEDTIDLLAGIRMEKKVGERVSAGDTIAYLYTSDEAKLDGAEALFRAAVTVSDTAPEQRPHIIRVISKEPIHNQGGVNR